MLSITDISIRIAGRLLIDHATAQIVPGARVGLVGRNGTGKSTLFHAIRGDMPTESGRITLPPRWRIGSLAQEAPSGPEPLQTLRAYRYDATLRGILFGVNAIILAGVGATLAAGAAAQVRWK